MRRGIRCGDGWGRRARRLALGLLLIACPGLASPAVQVVTTTPSLADLTRRIGGPHVEVESLMRGPENPHNVIPKPSFVVKLRKAAVFVHLGLDGEPWVPSLIRSARRPHLRSGQPGNVDASRGIALKEIPGPGGLSRALGDIHVYGNTHYILDPLNGIVIGRTLADALAQVDPEHADDYVRNLSGLERDLRALTERLTRRMQAFAGAPVVTYHRTWPYFLARFGLEKIAEVESKPGIAPGPRHIATVVERMGAREARVIIVESFSNRDIAARVASRVGGRALLLAQEVNAVDGVDSYEALFEYNVNAVIQALQETGASR